MKHTVSLITAMHAGCTLPEVPMIGKLRASFFQALEKTVRWFPMPGTDEQMKTKETT